jgi:hypothetical protein
MNYKAILITAIFMIALCSPALAAGVWRNDIFYTDEQYAKISDGCTMVVDPQSKVESCYRDNNPANSVEVYAGANTCTLEGNVRAGYNTLTKEVQLRNVNQSANETGIIIPIQPDGTFSYDGLAQGDYILKITPQFEGLGPEQVSSVHCTNGVTRPESELLGYAISVGDAKCVLSYKITSALYGLVSKQCQEVLVIPGVPAHTEYRYPTGYYEIHNWKWMGGMHGHWEVKCTNHAEHGDGWHYETPQCTEVKGYSAWTDTRNPWNHRKGEQSREVPAVDPVYEPVCEPYGAVIDVTSNVQQAIDGGHTSFLFNNAENPGGIFDITTTTLLSKITDPSVGNVKDVVISYDNGCGIEATIRTKEYCTIDLVAGTATCPSETPT